MINVASADNFNELGSVVFLMVGAKYIIGGAVRDAHGAPLSEGVDDE
ncbi:MAG: hypothetical protein LKE51_12555 [Selenomonas sp.]|nr:hypothetical protein [Selenomonas sp.]